MVMDASIREQSYKHGGEKGSKVKCCLTEFGIINGN